MTLHKKLLIGLCLVTTLLAGGIPPSFASKWDPLIDLGRKVFDDAVAAQRQADEAAALKRQQDEYAAQMRRLEEDRLAREEADRIAKQEADYAAAQQKKLDDAAAEKKAFEDKKRAEADHFKKQQEQKRAWDEQQNRNKQALEDKAVRENAKNIVQPQPVRIADVQPQKPQASVVNDLKIQQNIASSPAVRSELGAAIQKSEKTEAANATHIQKKETDDAFFAKKQQEQKQTQNNVNEVINETVNSTKKNISSQYVLSADEVLAAGEKFVGKGYREIGQPNSGVFRSADGQRQFRMDNNSLEGNHAPNVPHVHLEVYEKGAKKPKVNNHIPFND
jgi:hypothetical protein